SKRRKGYSMFAKNIKKQLLSVLLLMSLGSVSSLFSMKESAPREVKLPLFLRDVLKDAAVKNVKDIIGKEVNKDVLKEVTFGIKYFEVNELVVVKRSSGNYTYGAVLHYMPRALDKTVLVNLGGNVTKAVLEEELGKLPFTIKF
ncbi:MAG: hypothetical protein Q8Q25_02015, partial [bacterium]|nr:hypothetical protein [bacterium]